MKALLLVYLEDKWGILSGGVLEPRVGGAPATLILVVDEEAPSPAPSSVPRPRATQAQLTQNIALPRTQ